MSKVVTVDFTYARSLPAELPKRKRDPIPNALASNNNNRQRNHRARSQFCDETRYERAHTFRSGRITRSNGHDLDYVEPSALHIDALRVGDLLQDERPTPPEIVERLLRQGENMLLAGPPKSLKSFALQELGLSLSLGLNFLNFAVPVPRSVYWCQAEMPWHQSRDRLKAHPRVNEADLQVLNERFVITDRLETLIFDPYGVECVIESVREMFGGAGSEVFLLDSIASVYDQESEDSSAQMMTFLRQRIGRIRESFPGITIVLLHHLRKATARQLAEDPFTAIRGSGVLRGWYDGAIVMHREEDSVGEVKLDFELRGSVEPDSFSVEYEEGALVMFGEPATTYGGKRVELDVNEVVAAITELVADGQAFTLDRFCRDFGGERNRFRMSRENLRLCLDAAISKAELVYESQNPVRSGNFGRTKRPRLLTPVGYTFRADEKGLRPRYRLVRTLVTGTSR